MRAEEAKERSADTEQSGVAVAESSEEIKDIAQNYFGGTL